MRIGILALQGAFAEHSTMLRSLDSDTFYIRKKNDLDNTMNGMVIPGGESTTMRKLLNDMGMVEPVRSLIESGLPVMGTCAGAILLAEEIQGNDACLATIPMTIQRNAYGRQLGSFTVSSEFEGCGRIPMRFIRAPVIESVGKDVRPIASVDNRIVAARYDDQLAMTFHPEISGDTRVHEYFLRVCRDAS